MNKTILLLLCTLTYHTYAISIPDILWFPKNPIFDPTKCHKDSTKFEARINDMLSILCGNEDLNNGFDMKSADRKFNFNIYMTENRKDFMKRNATNAHRLNDCLQRKTKSQETQQMDVVVVKHKEKLVEISPMRNTRTYTHGKTYYFFTTSDGTKESLDNKIGKNDSMGFEVKICEDNKPCKQRIQMCLEKRDEDSQVVIGSTAPPCLLQKKCGEPVNDMNFNTACIILTVALALVLCIFAAFLLGKWYFTSKRSTSGHSNSNSDVGIMLQ